METESIKKLVTVASAIVALIVTISGGVMAAVSWVDGEHDELRADQAKIREEHVPQVDFDRFLLKEMQEDIRWLEKELRDPDLPPEVREQLEDDLAGLLDEYCLHADDPRRCDG